MKNCIFIWTLLLLSLAVNAQPGYYSGYIIRTNGDTLHGTIYQGLDQFNLKKCVFKRFELAFQKKYTAGDIKGYGLTGKRTFESRKNDRRHYFVEILVRGKYTLIKEKGKFIIETTGQPDIRLTVQEAKKLAEIISGNINTDTLKLNEGSLIGLVNKLNESAKSPSEVCKKSRSLIGVLDYSVLKNQQEIGFIGGTNIDMVPIFSDRSTYKVYSFLANSKFDLSAASTYGIYFVKPSLNRPKLAFVGDILYSNRFLHGSYYESRNMNWNDAFINLQNITVSIMCRRYVNDNKSRIYTQGGLYFSPIAIGTVKQYSDHKTGNNVTSVYSNNACKSDQIGLRAGIGWERRISARKFFVQMEAKCGGSQTGYQVQGGLDGSLPSKLYFATIQMQLIGGIKF